VTLVLAGSRLVAEADSGEEWARRVGEVDAALADDDVAAVTPRLRDAYLAALRSSRWEAMAEVATPHGASAPWLSCQRPRS
jgi:hypothetical protein